MVSAEVTTDDVKIESDDGVGKIVLNRPKALHALNHNMCAAILAALKSWAADDSVHMVLVTHCEDS